MTEYLLHGPNFTKSEKKPKELGQKHWVQRSRRPKTNFSQKLRIKFFFDFVRDFLATDKRLRIPYEFDSRLCSTQWNSMKQWRVDQRHFSKTMLPLRKTFRDKWVFKRSSDLFCEFIRGNFPKESVRQVAVQWLMFPISQKQLVHFR